MEFVNAFWRFCEASFEDGFVSFARKFFGESTDFSERLNKSDDGGDKDADDNENGNGNAQEDMLVGGEVG